jgi:hypothetical protein
MRNFHHGPTDRFSVTYLDTAKPIENKGERQ